MNIKFTNRHSLSAAIIVFYLIPFLFFSSYSIHLMSQNKSWSLLSLGLLLIVFGTLMLILFLLHWEESIQNKKELLSLVSSPPSNHFSTKEKETKVTSLDPKFHQDLGSEPRHSIDNKDSLKELNLLETTLKGYQDQQEELTQSLQIKAQLLFEQEEAYKQSQLKVQQISQDFSDYKLFSEEQLKQKQIQMENLQQIIDDQRDEMEKRQEQIHQLDNKIHDLSYEIKTLLYLHEDEETAPLPHLKEEKSRLSIQEPSELSLGQEKVKIALSEASDTEDESPVSTLIEANDLLKKCIQIAQKLTGANYYSKESSRYREFSSSYFAIDQRRLFDSLRSETGALIIVYSHKENKVIFANNESKNLLGWNSEKLISDFNSIMQDGATEWKNALHTLSTNFETHIRLLAKTKQGQEMLLNCNLGKITSGLFRNYLIGILYP